MKVEFVPRAHRSFEFRELVPGRFYRLEGTNTIVICVGRSWGNQLIVLDSPKYYAGYSVPNPDEKMYYDITEDMTITVEE